MQYLQEVNIDDNTIKYIEDSITYDDFIELSLSKDRVLGILEYFKSIGIKDIVDVLVSRTWIFYENVKDIKTTFDKCDILNIVDLINDDISNFNLIDL